MHIEDGVDCQSDFSNRRNPGEVVRILFSRLRGLMFTKEIEPEGGIIMDDKAPPG